MKPRTLILHGLTHYWRTNAAVVLGVATAAAVLAGALLVGDSVRGSLRDLVIQRLGRTDRVVVSADLFREALADDLRADGAFRSAYAGVAPIVALQGTVANQDTGRRAGRVQVYGVDDRFWRFHGVSAAKGPKGRDALLSRALAAEIGAGSGAPVIVRVDRPADVPIETIHGRKDKTGHALRLDVRGILPAEDMGDFSLAPSQSDVRAIFVALPRLQQDLDAAGRVNALLIADRGDVPDRSDAVLAAAIRRRFALDDVGLSVRAVNDGRQVAVESRSGLLDQTRSRAVEAAAGDRARPVLTYLANAITSGDRQIPYSLVTAIDLRVIAPSAAASTSSAMPPIVLNDWAARELRVDTGAPVTLEYYVWQEPGRLVTRSAEFRVAAVVAIAGPAADRDLAPVYPGITSAKRLGDWDPPFPIDLGRIRPQDEEYWERFRTTPKAFIPIEAGQGLWSSRFGDRTSMRIAASMSEPDAIVAAIRARIDPMAAGLAVRAVRAEGLAASRGATNFGEYFTYFSFFLVVSALMLAALFFRLGIEQRAREVGLLRAVGYTPRRVRGLLSAEGLALGAAGGVIGAAGAVAYAALMMAGLRTWWAGAVGTTALRLHTSPASLAAGAIGAIAAAAICIWWTLRGLSLLSERRLLAGEIGSRQSTRGSARSAAAAAAFTLLGATLIALGFAGAIDRSASFFGAGASLLGACLSAAAHALRRPPRSAMIGTGWRPMWRIGMRNAADRPGRSVLAIGVIASAAFILIAVDAFRRPPPAAGDRGSGVGGYALIVDLLLPIANDPNSAPGRDLVGLAANDGVGIDAFRVRPGDDASCLNLYEPRNPRVLGVTPSFIRSGRFAFQKTAAAADAERRNPWLLLEQNLGPDVVPVVGDANSLTYVLHKSVGDEVALDRGDRTIRLRIVGALSDSVFQRELLMSDANFTRLFPDQEGYRLLLVDAPENRVDAVASAIEDAAADLGADAERTTTRLAEFHTVENTYISTFQALGGLGLLVGTLGLAAVVLRNVLERRRELALLGAIGYRRSQLFAIVLAENLLLLGWGLGSGVVCAAVAIAPAVMERGGRLPTTSAAPLLIAVFAAGLLSSIVATLAALRTPLVAALRSE